MQEEKAIILDTQVSGKLPKYTDKNGKLIYKILSQGQLSFYLKMKKTHISSLDWDLEKYIPQFVGVQNLKIEAKSEQNNKSQGKGIDEWLNHISVRQREGSGNSKYIILKNLTFGYQQTCIMDIKLGKKLKQKPSNKKFSTSTTNSHNFRINGMKIFHKTTNQHRFINKYYFQKTTQQQIQSHLAYFFFDGSIINVKLIQKCVSIVKNIVFSLLSFKSGSFHSSSLLICYDGKNHSSFQVKLIDFDKYMDEDKDNSDHNIIEGLKYIVGYLSDIIDCPNTHQNLILQKQLKFFKDQFDIPEAKIKQFEGKKQKKVE